MAGIWIYSEDSTGIKEMLTLAKELAKESHQMIGAVTLDADVATDLTGLGAGKVIVLKGDSNWPEAYEQALTEILQEEKAEIVLIGGTISGKYTAAKVAARMNAGLATDAVKVSLAEDGLLVERIIYGGLAISTEVVSFPAFVTIPPRSYESGNVSEGSGEVIEKEVTFASQISVVSTAKIEHQGVDIAKADKVVGIGRGVAKQDDLALIEELAKSIHAEVGCTRPVAEDAKWLPIDRYIGISGKTITGSLYITVGASGQIQHVAGIRDVKTIVAINSDENAPIFAAADYGIVGDYTEILPALASAIQKEK